MKELPVLVVEDEGLVQDLIVEGLEEAGYRVHSVSSAEEAFKLIEDSEHWAGLVTDINLGRGQSSGWDVARRAREKHADIPVIYVSGDSSHDWTARGVPHSVMVPKPFATSQIVVALAELLNARAKDI